MNSTRLKKNVAVITLLISGAIELFFAGVLFIQLFTEDVDARTTISFIFCIAIFAFPIWWSIRVLKSGSDKESNHEIYEENSSFVSGQAVEIKTKIEPSEYRRIAFRITYAQPIIIFLHVIGLGMIAFYLLSPEGSAWFPSFFGLFLLYLPIAVYRSAVSNYKSSKSIHELLSYHFSPEGIVVQGETYNATMAWQTFYKLKETTGWFMLYTNKTSAIFIPKKSFTSKSDVALFLKYAASVNSA